MPYKSPLQLGWTSWCQRNLQPSREHLLPGLPLEEGAPKPRTLQVLAAFRENAQCQFEQPLVTGNTGTVKYPPAHARPREKLWLQLKLAMVQGRKEWSLP